MREDIRLEAKGFKYHETTGYYNKVLPVGCRYCLMGAKIVVFITGICLDKCWYCPISREKKGRDVIFVDEEPVRNINEIILEAYRVNAFGAGITGGDPIYVIDRTYNVVKELKKEFGDKFHIHLYTSGRLVDENILGLLEESGVDEVRFHIYDRRLISVLKKAVKTGMDIGVEVPFIPLDNYIEFLKSLLVEIESIGVKFVNINELEVSETNIEAMVLHGLTPQGLTVKETLSKLKEFLSWCSDNVKNLAIHYCTLSYKDNVQFRRRMIRKALNTLGAHEVVTKDGTNISIVVEEPVEISRGIFINFYGRNYVVPTEGCLLKDSGVEAKVIEYYPLSNTILNERSIKY